MIPSNANIDKLKEHIMTGDIQGMVDCALAASLELEASDIHIEPRKNLVVIRYRIDGELEEVVEYPNNLHSGVISKLKLMSQLKIDESRVPQDGRLTTFVQNREIDLRVSTLPTVNGEKVVMRIVDKSKAIPTLENLGIVGENLRRFSTALKAPNGILLTSGPTGSGKTTTMYSAMSRINDVNVNILTLEDPVENQMEGLNQSQIRPDIDYTFANGLRTALRQDPDIIMVGEIRDKETIDIAIEASLTGHLVLSTIHTNSAVETITRILNMKVPDFLLVSSINLIIAQRLSKKLCDKCRVPVDISESTAAKVASALAHFHPYEGLDTNIFQSPQFFGPGSGDCPHCGGDGYRGRVGLYEVLIMTEDLKKAIIAGMPANELLKVAIKDGMTTMEQDGIIKALQGQTSLEEVYKLVKK